MTRGMLTQCTANEAPNHCKLVSDIRYVLPTQKHITLTNVNYLRMLCIQA